jgi:S1-C subfamily serine protease
MKRTTLVCSSLVFGSALVASVTGGCGPSTPKPVAPPPSASVSAKAPTPEGLKVAPRICNGRKLIGTIVAQQADQADSDKKEAGKKDDKVSTAAADTTPESGGGSFQKAYQSVAPATVVIKAKTGFGSGVIVDKSGLILTNYHVVAHGLQPDFTIKVTLNFGHKSATGGMEIDDKTYEGFIVKADRVRDLALIRVKDGPKDPKFAPISKSDPTPGQAVSAVGHAGIGMLWAMKSCHVAAVGEPARNSFITARDCGATAEMGITDPDELKRVKEQCEKSKTEARNAISEFREGLFVQSDCRVAPGDSGGPLVNEKGEIVGLNQSVSADSRTASGTSYHVHAAELREFTANVPAEAVQVTPDPWCDGGSETELVDIDFDGEPDGVMATSMESRSLFGPQRFALLLDVDEGQKNHDMAAELAAGKTNMPYDAEVALLSLPVGTFVWYDSDDDGFFDVLLSDPEDKGKPQAVFDIDHSGKVTERKGFKADYFFDTKFLPNNEKMHTHLGKFASIINSRLTCPELLADAKSEIPVPDPVKGIGQKGRLGDLDGNGKPDTIVFSGAFARGASIDADEDAIGGLKPVDDPSPIMKAGKVDAEITLFMLPSSVWVVYDRDNDNKADLAMLANTESDDRISTQAFVRSGTGAWTPSKDFIGQRAMRPALVGIPRAQSIARSIFNFSASDEGLGTLPDPMPIRGYYDWGSFRKKPEDKKPTQEKAVLQGHRGDYWIRLFDADKDTKAGAKDTASDLVREKKFDVDVAVVSDDDIVWVFYDTDQDKKFDLVLIGFTPSTGIADRALRVQDGRLVPDTQLAGGKLYLHKGIFKDAKVGTGFKKLATDFLPARAIQE